MQNKLRFNNNLKNIIPFLFLILFLLFFIPSYGFGVEYNRENAVVRAIRKVSPAVVNISSEYEIRKRANPFSRFGIDPFFDSFFKDFFDPGFERRYKRTSLGSGVIIDGKRGFILTNEHVIAKSGTITVVLKDEREFEAQVVGADPDSDLSVLRIVSKEPLPAIEMGSSDDLMIGETVIAIGNPFGFSHTVTTGVISANNRSIRTNEKVYHDFIQIDASINPGNSGGPLLNINGELIGINTAIYAKAQGIGFAIPINKAKRIISDLIQYGEVIQAWIGITVQDLDEKLANYMKTAGIKGALVKKVEIKSPAGKAGVQDGDIILSLGTRSLNSSEDYRTVMKNFATGDRVKIRVLRNGQELTLYVKALKFPDELAMNLAFETFGVKVEDLTFNKRLKYKTYTKEGVVISELNRQSYLYNIGARPGDVIRQLGEVIIKNKKDFTKAVVKYRQKRSVVILLQRGDQSYYITIRL